MGISTPHSKEKTPLTMQNMNTGSTLSHVDVWDGWRGIAISFLLMGHFLDLTWIWEDRMGVDIFFVLSGMLMSKILFEKRMNLKDFYIRRFSRIFPSLIVFIAVSYSFATLMSLNFELREIFANLLFIRTYYPAEPHIWSVDVPVGHLWSLNVEEHAYLLMSLITLLFLRNRETAWLLLALGFASIFIGFLYYFQQEVPDPRFRIRTEAAASFVFLSAGYGLIRNKLGYQVGELVPLLTFIASILCYVNATPEWFSFALAPIFLAFTVNHLTEARGIFEKILLFRPIRLLGIWSFSIYLWQQPFYSYSEYLPGGYFTGIILALIAGIAAFHLIENPLRRRINALWTHQFTLNPQKA